MQSRLFPNPRGKQLSRRSYSAAQGPTFTSHGIMEPTPLPPPHPCSVSTRSKFNSVLDSRVSTKGPSPKGSMSPKAISSPQKKLPTPLMTDRLSLEDHQEAPRGAPRGAPRLSLEEYSSKHSGASPRSPQGYLHKSLGQNSRSSHSARMHSSIHTGKVPLGGLVSGPVSPGSPTQSLLIDPTAIIAGVSYNAM